MASYALQPQQGDPNLQTTGLRVERDRMKQELGLNAEEKARIEAIINDESAKFKALRQEKRTRLHATLKPEQMAKLDAVHQKHQSKWADNGEGNNH